MKRLTMCAASAAAVLVAFAFAPKTVAAHGPDWPDVNGQTPKESSPAGVAYSAAADAMLDGAIKTGDMHAVESALRAGANAGTALRLAVEVGRTSVVYYVLNSYPVADAYERKGPPMLERIGVAELEAAMGVALTKKDRGTVKAIMLGCKTKMMWLINKSIRECRGDGGNSCAAQWEIAETAFEDGRPGKVGEGVYIEPQSLGDYRFLKRARENARKFLDSKTFY